MSDGGEALGIGIDVGGTKILACALNAKGLVVASSIAPSPSRPDGLARVLLPLLDSLIADLAGSARAVRGIGLALPGLVDAAGVLHAAPNLGASVSNFDARAVLEPLLCARLSDAGAVLTPSALMLENDATSAAIAEVHIGAAAGARDAIVISFGTGIGAGIVTNGEVVRGGRRFAGEIGHIVIDPNGPLCGCGRHGCWETFASGVALTRLAREHLRGELVSDFTERFAMNPDELRGEDVVEAARGGDVVARSVIEEFAHFVGLGLSNVVELLDPELMVFAGGLAAAQDVLLDPVRTALAAASRPSQRLAPHSIVAAQLGDKAAAIGAGLLALGLYQH